MEAPKKPLSQISNEISIGRSPIEVPEAENTAFTTGNLRHYTFYLLSKTLPVLSGKKTQFNNF
jgi:hypothetical protein